MIKNFIQASPSNFTRGRSRRIDTIVIHYTATNASAINNLKYFSRPGTRSSAHYFVDKNGDIYQSVKDEDTAWHAGNASMNARAIGIEVVSAGQDFTRAQILSLNKLVTYFMKKYGVSKRRVIRHYDVTGKLCPAPYISADKWRKLHGQITTGNTQANVKKNTIRRRRLIDTEENMNVGLTWKNGNTKYYTVFNTASGFWTQWNGSNEDYNKSVFKAFGINFDDVAEVSQSHINAIAASCTNARKMQ